MAQNTKNITNGLNRLFKLHYIRHHVTNLDKWAANM